VRKLIVIALAAAASLLIAAVAFGAAATTLQVVASPNKASTKKKLRAIALTVNVSFADPALPQPPPLKRVVIRLNKGGTYNGKLFPKCTEAKLAAKGRKGCPKGSYIGNGSATASAKPIIDLVNAKVYLFNGPVKGGSPTILLYSIPDISSPITVSGSVVKKPSAPCANGTGQCDYNIIFDVPDIPTLPNAPPASVLTVNTKTFKTFIKKKKKVHGKKRTVKIPLVAAPNECKGGKWVADSTVNFKDGQTATAVASAPCKK
jgi:hypothetical protein